MFLYVSNYWWYKLPNQNGKVLKCILISKMLRYQFSHDSILDFLTKGMSALDIESSLILADHRMRMKCFYLICARYL